jgi:hypothetical protein
MLFLSCLSTAATSLSITSRFPANGQVRPHNSILKLFVVVAGYGVALVAACTATYIRQLNTQGPNAQASAGMDAFGDASLFVAVFGILALFPTGLSLYFLRPARPFWTTLATGALTLAATGLFCAGALELVRHLPSAPAWLQLVAGLGVLRMLGAPLLVFTFLLCACLAPTRFSRWALVGATGLEGLVAAYSVLNWFILPNLR